MKPFSQAACGLSVVVAGLCLASQLSAAPTYATHPPQRPLPAPSTRPAGDGPVMYVDPQKGDDAADGSLAKPWRTLDHALRQLKPGTTLHLRGGIYYESAILTVAGETDKPVTVRSHPGEIAIIDASLRQFTENPAAAWEPCPDGAPGEYQSTATFPDGPSGQGVHVLGNFADSMVPLQGYRFLGDLRSDNPYWNIEDKSKQEQFVYCGPGVTFNPKTQRIHCRLAHTNMPWLGDDNYRGETDPRQVPMVITMADGESGAPPLTVRNSSHVRLMDITMRGGRAAPLVIDASTNIELDGLTLYGGGTAMSVKHTTGLRAQHTAFRGIAAPWTYRAALKYRSIEARLISTTSWQLTGADNSHFEFAWCEFTDSIDGVFIGNVRGVRTHHCLMDNLSDDGFFVTAVTGYDGKTHGGDLHFHQNLISRTLTSFAFGVGHGRQKSTSEGKQLGAGMWIYRNVFDYRRPVMYYWPANAERGEESPDSFGRPTGDHGSPIWEPMFIYHNTFIAGESAWRDYYLLGLGGHGMGANTTRRLFNNIAVHAKGKPGLVFGFDSLGRANIHADHNLLWSHPHGEEIKSDFFQKLHAGSWKRYFDASKAIYPPGVAANDMFANPAFVKFGAAWHDPLDLTLNAGSAAIDKGQPLDENLPDPLRAPDSGPPDIGAIPHGTTPWRVGVGGRLDAFGNAVDAAPLGAVTEWVYPHQTQVLQYRQDVKPAAMVLGYPAPDGPILDFALAQLRVPVDTYTRQWLSPAEFSRYSMVVYEGSLSRGKVEPAAFTADELNQLQTWLQAGGTLLLMRDRTEPFRTKEGMMFLERLLGPATSGPDNTYAIRIANHPWVRDVADNVATPWSDPRTIAAMATRRGQAIVATESGKVALLRLPVGKGQIIYHGWTVASALPEGRKPSTVEREQAYETQFCILFNLLDDVYKQR